MRRKNGKFIVIEGIDGSGKSTQVELLKNKLPEFHFTREASDGPIGTLLRRLFLTGERQCDERVINMLYVADRLDHITNKTDGILKSIISGCNVICDRYYLSSMAYNSYMMETNEKMYKMINQTISMNAVNMSSLRPDLTIYIDTPPEVACQRINIRNEDKAIYETPEKLEKIYQSYKMSIAILLKDYKENIVIVDGSKSPEEIHNEIYGIIQKLLNQ